MGKQKRKIKMLVLDGKNKLNGKRKKKTMLVMTKINKLNEY